MRIVKTICDIDGQSDADATREVWYDGTLYTLDLANEHDKRMHDEFMVWLDRAHSKIKMKLPVPEQESQQTAPTKARARSEYEKLSDEDRIACRMWLEANEVHFSKRPSNNQVKRWLSEGKS